MAERDHIIASRNLNSAQAQWQSAKAEASSAAADIQQTRSDTQAYLDSTSAVINKIRGETADSENSLHNSEISLARQNMQRIVAPQGWHDFQVTGQFAIADHQAGRSLAGDCAPYLAARGRAMG